MERVKDPRGTSLEAWTDWLRERRREVPVAPLADLLADRSIDPGLLVDLACIDLIQQRRSGRETRVEHYAADFPQLRQDDRLLDLIDAEICVAMELQQTIESSQYLKRFPELGKSIEALLGLEIAPGSVPLGANAGFDAEIDEPQQPIDDATRTLALDTSTDGHPLQAPEWFHRENCLARGPGRWLIRGRDLMRARVLVMKVIQLPPLQTGLQAEQLLDACEAASKVRHPTWVAPEVAAIEQGHLGVIRPWVFGVPWRSAVDAREPSDQLRDLASLAYCLEAAHQVGSAHGAIHLGNLLLDHGGTLRLVDAVASQVAMQSWLDAPREPNAGQWIKSLARRQQGDGEDLIELVRSIVSLWQTSWTRLLIDELDAAVKHPELKHPELKHPGQGVCGVMGATLIRYADGLPGGAAVKPDAPWKPWRRWLRSGSS